MKMPDPDAAVIERRLTIADDLRALVPGEGVIVDDDDRRAYDSDLSSTLI